jgi:3-oxoacyl-[acyl-carrier protein] reductase
MSLSGQKILITGGSRGIGAAVVTELARRGASVAINYRSNAEAAETLVAQATEMGVEAVALGADVSNYDEAGELVRQAVERLDGLTGLINNAGITRDKFLMAMKRDDWDAVLDTNLGGAYNVTHHAIRKMLRVKDGASIVNIASVSGIVGNKTQCNYSAAKAGLIGFTKALAKEVASKGVRVNCVAPGFIETDMTRDLPEQILSGIGAVVPLGRIGQASEIAAAVAFLMSAEAAYITGQTLVVDGGMTM